MATIARFRELLLTAGAAAANCQSAGHRAAALADIERMGLEWTAGLATPQAALVEAIGATVRALVGAETAQARLAVGSALRALVTAARAAPPLPTPPQTRWQPPPGRRWWMRDND